MAPEFSSVSIIKVEYVPSLLFGDLLFVYYADVQPAVQCNIKMKFLRKYCALFSDQ